MTDGVKDVHEASDAGTTYGGSKTRHVDDEVTNQNEQQSTETD
jgi:hypothetical protein